MKLIFTLFLFSLFVSCSKYEIGQSENRTTVQNLPVKKIENELKAKTLEKLHKPTTTINLSEIKEIGENALIRYSNTKDENGWMIPPYESAIFKIGGFENEPRIGEKVTAIPLQVKLEPFQIAISKVIKTPNIGCVENNEKSFFWAIELETIIDREILEIAPVSEAYKNQMPFSIFFIYPAVEFANALDKSKISKSNFPRNISLKRIESAIDLDNDSKPDLLSVKFCCGEPERESAENCPYLCQKYYRKSDGTWKVFNIQDFKEIC